MLRVCSNGMCKEYKNGNITIRFNPDTIEAARKDGVATLANVLEDFDCYFIGETYCLSNYAEGHTIYNAYSDLAYTFDWNLLAVLKAGEMVRIYARTLDETDREILEQED